MNPISRTKLINSIAEELNEHFTSEQIVSLLKEYKIEITYTYDSPYGDEDFELVIHSLKDVTNEKLKTIGNHVFPKNDAIMEDSISVKKSDKIFISHANANDNYGSLVVELLLGVGVKPNQIIYTSNVAHGIPTGKNIFDWLRDSILVKPLMIYLLSPEYFKSYACLNEMGAAWVIGNEHITLFTPNFKIDSKEFQNCAIDSKKIGFYVDNKDRLIAFIEGLRKDFEIITEQVIISQRIDAFLQATEVLKKVEPIKSKRTGPTSEGLKELAKLEKESVGVIVTSADYTHKSNPTSSDSSLGVAIVKFFSALCEDKLKDEEMLLLHYAMETSRCKFGTGWQEVHEREYIVEWEELNELKNTLSNDYAATIRRFELRNLVKVSATTEQGNPKEVEFVEEFKVNLLDMPEEFEEKLAIVLQRQEAEGLPF